MKKVGLISLLILVILPALAFANETTYTGCLNAKSGVLKDVAMGQEPSRPCAPPYVEIQWNQEGPRGPQGIQGPTGPQGPQGVQGPPGALIVSPPTITYSLTCEDALTVNTHIEIVDDEEIAYYAIQLQGGNPPVHMIFFMEPALNAVTYDLPVSTPNTGTQTYLIITSDTKGNVSKALFQIDHDMCLGECPEGTICP